MFRRFAMSDIIVVLPGIMGSTLVDRDGVELWGTNAGTVLRMIASFGRNTSRLRLPSGIGDGDPDDGVRPRAVIGTPHFLSRLFGADGYDDLLAWIWTNFDVRQPADDVPGNLIIFPYDWRLSNRLNAQRLGIAVLPALERWRARGNPHAKLRFICHSMGGLIARWFIEKCGGREVTRQLITLGTPYSGSIEALLKLANGFNPKFGPLCINLSDMVRSLPSAYQLLPTYRSVVTTSGRKRVDDVSLPYLDSAMVADSMAFHDDALSAARLPGLSYGKFVLTGTAQPTLQTAVVKNSAVEGQPDIEGVDFSGDGTVPRLSSYPPEWVDDSAACTFPQQHAVLQSDSNVVFQMRQILTANVIAELAAPTRQIGLDVPEVITAGEDLHVLARCLDGDHTLPLQAEVRDENGQLVGARRLLFSYNNGDYSAIFSEVPAGLLKITLASAALAFPLNSVTSTTLVWHSAAGGSNS